MVVADVSRQSVRPETSAITNQRCITSQKSENFKFLKFKLT